MPDTLQSWFLVAHLDIWLLHAGVGDFLEMAICGLTSRWFVLMIIDSGPVVIIIIMLYKTGSEPVVNQWTGSELVVNW